MDSISDNDMAELERLAAAATPGPWQVADAGGGPLAGWPRWEVSAPSTLRKETECGQLRTAVTIPAQTGLESDARYIAAAHPGAVAGLIQRVRAAEGEQKNRADAAEARAQQAEAAAVELRLLAQDVVSDLNRPETNYGRDLPPWKADLLRRAVSALAPAGAALLARIERYEAALRHIRDGSALPNPSGCARAALEGGK